MSGGKLPTTGSLPLMVGGIAMTQTSLAVSAAALVALGIVLVAAATIRTRWHRAQRIN